MFLARHCTQEAFQSTLGQGNVEAVQHVNRETIKPVKKPDGVEVVENVLVR